MSDKKGFLKKAIPVLASLNIPETIAFYEEKLGFTKRFCDEGYGIVSRDEILINFWKCEDKIHPENTSCYINVENADALYEEMQQAGVVHPNGKLQDTPWGMREFAILDKDGNLIRFGQELKKSKG